MTRPGQPIDLLITQGKTHLTKEQITERKAAEIRVGIPLYFSPPYYLRGNRWALRQFKKRRDEYMATGHTFITSSDVEFLARYCERWARYRELKKACDKAPIECLKDVFFMENKLQSLHESLVSMEKELFFTPQSKFRNVPRKQEKPQQTELEKKGFDL